MSECTSACRLCAPPAPEAVLWRDARARVIDAAEPGYPGFCRVIWNAHVCEMSDLGEPERARLMRIVWGVEEVLRRLLRPDKINLASLGNRVAHLHWHVIPRFADDPHFPDAVWAPPQRAGAVRALDAAALRRALVQRLGAGR